MTEYLSPLAANVIGIIGSVLFIIGFAYANIAKVLNQLLFNALNLAGAILLLISLSVHFNLAAVVLEVAWAGIALAGLVRAVWGRYFLPSRLREGAGEGLSDSAALETAPPLTPPASGRGI